MDFDPQRIGYRDLLAVFWQLHDPFGAPFSRQYKAVVFYHSAEQERLARETAAAAQRGRDVQTEIRPAERFWLAEDYHQKHQLRNTELLIVEVEEYYDPASREFIDSTLAARMNAYAAMRGHESILLGELDSYGVSADAQKVLRQIAPLLRSEAVAACGVVDSGL